jgi:RHS repeat-associated protein
LVEENRVGTLTTYVPDTLGSVIQTLDASGGQTSSAEYWPFGELRTSSGTNPSPWGFVGTLGYYADTLLRLYIRARCYLANAARWIIVDPLWPITKTYAYASSNPITKSDPSGLWIWIGVACAAAGLAGGIIGLLNGDSGSTALCKGLLDCAIAAIAALILPEDPGLGACLIGGGAAQLSSIAERLCSHKPPIPCPEEGPSLKCLIIIDILNFFVGCIGGGGEGGELQDALIGLVGALGGADCEAFGTTSVPVAE